jgi:predicted NBD/HSP70 family sugar kinase
MNQLNDQRAVSRRVYNQGRIVEILTRHGSLTRADLARHTRLSRATVALLVNDLLADNRLQEQASENRDRPHAGRGRPAGLLALTDSAGIVIGITFGHSDIRVAAATLSGGLLEERHRQFPVDNSAPQALDAATDEFRSMLDTIGRRTADLLQVVGLPAPIHQASGRVMMNNILPGWIDYVPTDELCARIQRPVVVENDANLAAYGEMAYGVGKGARDIVFLKASVGIGAGLILAGRLHRGTTGYAGELGHVQTQPDGPLCRCGSRGCLETQVGLPHILAALQPFHAGLSMSLTDLVALVSAGDSGAVRVLTDAGRTIGRLLADLCNVLNPQKLIIGGELSTAGEALTQGVREAVGRFAQPIVTESLTVETGSLHGRAEVLGALALASRILTNSLA